MQMALTPLWAPWGDVPDPVVVIGHSLGEYAALNIAGVLSESDAIHLTGNRAQFMEDRCNRGTHDMLAGKASVSKIADYLDHKTFEVACMNTPEEMVLGGTNKKFDEVSETLSAHGGKSIKQVPYAFYCSQVQPLLESFEITAHCEVFPKNSIPILCPLLGNVMT